VTEIQAGLATAAELEKVPKSDGTVAHNATALAAITADVVGDAVIAELTTQGDTNETKIDAVKVDTAASKVQTDKMVFTKANELDTNTKSINDAEVVGNGNSVPWDGV